MIKFIHEFPTLYQKTDIGLFDKNGNIFCSAEITPHQKYLLYEEKTKTKHDIYLVTNPLFVKEDFYRKLSHSINSDFVYFRAARETWSPKDQVANPKTLYDFSIEIDQQSSYSCFYYLYFEKGGWNSAEILITKEN